MNRSSLKTLRGWLPPRPEGAHKGDFGHVLVLAGSCGMTGAAVLTARAALRAGCGLLTLAIPESQQPIVAGHLVEAMTLPLPETSSGAVRGDAVGRLQASHQSRGYRALAVGPGLSTNPETAKAVLGVLGSLDIPVVIDGDALNLIALQPRNAVRTLLERRSAPHIFTPHPGELARLLKVNVSRILAEREESALSLCADLGGVCLLKGPKTLITDGRRTWENPTGNAGLAKGGSGDALTGVIAGLWSQRLWGAVPPGQDPAAPAGGFEAAALGAYLHGLAADIAAREKTTRALLASDVVEALPAAFRKLGGQDDYSIVSHNRT